MTWTTVASGIVFKVSGDTWGGTTSAVSDADKNSIIAILENMYNLSPKAAALLEAAAAMGPIRFSTSASRNPGFRGSNIDGSFPFIALNLGTIDTLRYFNDQGSFVSEIRGLTIIHEIAHHVHTPPEDDPTYSETAMNGAGYDFDGPIVDRQNEIAREMGWLDNIQRGYQTGIIPSDGRYNMLGGNYTDGRGVDVVRFGDEELRFPGGSASNDNVDHSLRTDKLRDLVFGLGGEDNLNGGKGSDYLYGGQEDDTFIGSDGDDLFHGGGTRDATGAAVALDDDGEDTADYSAAAASEFIKITTDVTVNSFHSNAIDAALGPTEEDLEMVQ